MSGNRFSNVRAPEVKQEQRETAADQPQSRPARASKGPEVPPAPPALQFAPQRDTFSVRVRRELSDDFVELVKRYRRQGWAVDNGTVMEHFMEQLRDPAYAQQFMMEIAEKRALERAGRE